MSDRATASAGVRRTRGRRRAGLSLVETMISLAITATLLTAVAAAYSASTKAIQVNDQFFRASQSARVCVNQLLAEIRQCSIVEVSSGNLNVLTATGEAKTYRYDAAAQRLLLSVTDVNGTTDHTLGSNISSLTFAGNGSNVSIAITVTAGTNTVTLGGSCTPRRKVVYR